MNSTSGDPKSIFLAAAELTSPAERVAYLDAACAGNTALRRDVEEMLEHHAQLGSFLQSPASAPAVTVDHAAAEGPGAVIGPYKLVEEIGEGGMGAVYLAQQTEPVKRLVALKVIKAGMDSRQVLARFEAERQALALMDHPNIAKVLDAGATTAGRPYFVMELVKGVPITKFCDERKLTPRERLELFLPVCHAIQHAHQKGVIHRDIKPNNVLVALYDGKPVPKVIDFGVAKAAGQPLTDRTLVTNLGAVVGTPEYMSPEQAELNQLDIDTRSDIYSLGVLLYELLTGTTPLQKKRVKAVALLEVLRLVREEEPPRLSSRLSSTEMRASIAAVRGMEPAMLAKAFRGELDWIAMKALEKNRARRYETANALARDVQRYLADEVVEARPPSVAYRARKFVRRYKGSVVAGSLILLAVIGGLIGAAFGVIEAGNQRVANSLREQAERDRDAADKARGDAETARKEAETARDGEKVVRSELFREKEKLAVFEYGRTIQVAHQHWRDDHILAARRLLDGTRKDLRGWEWHYLHRLCHADLITLEGHGSWVKSAAFSQDGKRVLTASRDDTARVWDSWTGAEVCGLGGLTFPDAPVITRDDLAAAFSPDGSQVVTTSVDDTARISDARTGAERRVLRGHTARVNSAVFSPNGLWVATGSEDLTARVWNAKSGDQLLILKGHTARLHSAVFSPDGSMVVTASCDNTARAWDAKNGDLRFVLKGHTGFVQSAVFSPNGAQVLTGSADGTARVWDAKTGNQLFVLKGHTGSVNSAVFSPDGKRVVTASMDGTARVWDATTRAEVAGLKGHTWWVYSAVFSPDGERVVTASKDMTARVWDATTGDQLLVLKGHTSYVNSAMFSPDGSRVITASDDNTARVWDVGTGAELPTFRRRNSQGARSAAFTPDGPRVVTSSQDKDTALVWDARTGTVLFALKGHTGFPTSAMFSVDGARLVTGSPDGTARVWDARTGDQLLVLKGHTGHVHSAAFSPDRTRVVTGSADTSARVWDATTGDQLLVLRGHTNIVTSAAFNLDGTRVVTGSKDTSARVWDARTGAELAGLKGHTWWVLSTAFSPDGTQVVTASGDGTARVWDVRTGAEFLTLKGHTYPVLTAAFSPDGARVVTGSADGTARVWDARTGAEFLTLKQGVHGGGFTTAVFSADGTQIMTVIPGSSTRAGAIATIATAVILDSRPVNRAFLPREVAAPREVAPPPRGVKY